MEALRNPRWLYLSTVLPFILLFSLGYYQFTLVESVLEPRVVASYRDGGYVLGGLIALAFVLAAGLDAAGRRLGVVGFLVPYLSSLAVLGYAFFHTAMFSLPGVPAWLHLEELSVAVLACSMPGILFAVAGAIRLTARGRRARAATRDFGIALLLPVGLYLLGVVVLPLVNPYLDTGWEDIAGLVLVTIVITLFLFLIGRGSYVLLRRSAGAGPERTAVLVLLTLVLPVAGLLLNDHFGTDGRGGAAVFGDFTHPLFYALAVANGLYCSLPRRSGPLVYRLLLFVVGCIGLPFILYFALVFLPVVPLSVFALLLLGSGALTLAPILIVPVHCMRLLEDAAYLRTAIDRRVVMAGGLLLIAVLPLGITHAFWQDRRVLRRTLDYVYAPASNPRPVAKADVTRVLDHVRRHRNKGWSPGARTQPYLSRYYAWLVLDNLTLSNEKLQTLEAVYFGDPMPTVTDVAPASDPIDVTAARVVTNWDEDKGAWLSWVHLELLADTSLRGSGTYRAAFDLPDGAFIDDYYLYVGDRRESGILAERRSATWVYRQIVGAQRDPGLLRYVSADRVALEVFPFAPGELRQTGFRVMHREPLKIRLGDRLLPLGRPGERPVEAPIAVKGATYLPARVKQQMEHVTRRPRIHYVIDASRRTLGAEERWVEAIRKYQSALPDSLPPARVVLSGTAPRTLDYRSRWAQRLSELPTGGFFAQRAVESVLRDQLDRPDATYPVFVVVGNDPVFTRAFPGQVAAPPEGLHLYYLTEDGRAITTTPTGTDTLALPPASTVVGYPGPDALVRFLPAEGPSLVTGRDSLDLNAHRRVPGTWRRALELRGRYAANRQTGRTGASCWLEEVRGSFGSGVLMPTTAFIVVENDAQRKALERRQDEVLGANPHFDLDETLRMSEPADWWYLLLLPLVLYLLPARRRP